MITLGTLDLWVFTVNSIHGGALTSFASWRCDIVAILARNDLSPSGCSANTMQITAGTTPSLLHNRHRSDCRFCRNTLSATVSGGLKLMRVHASANSSSNSAWPGLSRCALPRRTPDADISLHVTALRLMMTLLVQCFKFLLKGNERMPHNTKLSSVLCTGIFQLYSSRCLFGQIRGSTRRVRRLST